MSQPRRVSPTPPTSGSAAVPAALRVGGSLLAIAVMLFITYGVAVARGGMLSSFPVTVGFVMTVVAAGIVGAFFSVGAAQRASIRRSVALVCAVILIVASRIIPSIVVVTTESAWLIGYAVVCLIGGLVARRRVINHDK